MLILASNSPRRKQLLTLGGWAFSCAAAPVDESVLPGEAPEAYVRRLAEAKARAALDREPGLPAEALVVAADTTVVDGEQILGKPVDPAEAQQMLRQLRDRRHQVYTGLAVLRAGDGQLHLDAVVTDVWMRDYSDAEMQAYIASGDPLDKAGAYAIQHAEFNPVARLDGCAANVVGLPVCRLAQAIEALGGAPASPLVQRCLAEGRQGCALFNRLAEAGL